QVIGRDAEWDPGLLDLPLRARQPALHRLWLDEESARDLLRCQAAERAQREGDLRLERERRMAAHEDQLEALIGNVRLIHLVLLRLRQVEQLRLLGERASAAAAGEEPAAGGGVAP